MKFLKSKTISEIKEMFSQMDSMSLGESYREFVEIKANASSQSPIIAPFSDRIVAYYESKYLQVAEIKEEYRDNGGNLRTRLKKQETTVSEEKSSQTIMVNDNSCKDNITVDVQADGCRLDIPKTFDKFEPKTNLNHYGYFLAFPIHRFGAENLEFRMIEITIKLNQPLYIIGEAFRIGTEIHIGMPSDNSKPFIVSTKTEHEVINNNEKIGKIALFGGITLAVFGVLCAIYPLIFSTIVKEYIYEPK